MFWGWCCLCGPCIRRFLRKPKLLAAVGRATTKSHKKAHLTALTCMSASGFDLDVDDSAAGCGWLLGLWDLKLNFCLSLLAADLNLLRAWFEVLVPASC